MKRPDIKIYIQSNGFTLESTEETKVIECPDYDCPERSEAQMGLLYSIMEMLGIFWTNQKYDKNSIEVKHTHGYKYCCSDKDCKICKGEEY